MDRRQISGPLTIPIRVHWSLAALVIPLNVVPVVMIIGMLTGFSHSSAPEGELMGIIVYTIVIGIVDALVIPLYRSRFVRFDDEHLSIFLGVHKDVRALREKRSRT